MSKKKETEEKKNLEQELAEMKSLLQRTQADFLNYKARTDKEKAESSEYGRIEAILSLLPILDSLKRAENHLPKDLQKNEWVLGIASITKQLTQKLGELGVKKIETVGAEFDPEYHEALMSEASKEKSGVVIEEFEPGYIYKDRVIRYAKVKTAK